MIVIDAPGKPYNGFSYQDLLAGFYKSEKTAEPFYELLKDARKIQEKYADYHKEVRRKRPALADCEIRMKFINEFSIPIYLRGYI